MKKHLNKIFAGLLIVIATGIATTSNSTPPPPPCECCYTEHDSQCLDCSGGITLFSYNCGLIEPRE